MKRFLIILIAACGSDSSTPGGDDDPMPDAPVMPDPDPGVVNFKTEIVPIFDKSCGTGTTGCHGRDAYGANANMDCRGWLALENADLGDVFYAGPSAGDPTGCGKIALYDRLMTLDVWQCSAATAYIAPSNVADSYIMHKINGTGLCKESSASVSDPMPPPQPDNPNPFTLSAADKALIQQWIAEGAQNN